MSANPEPLLFEDVIDLMAELGAHCAVAELHGFLVGQLCAGVNMTPELWLSKALDFMEADPQIETEDAEELVQIYHSTQQQLRDDDNIFYPLLPDDADELASRLAAFGQWCDGYLGGFALIEPGPKPRQFSEDINQALQDIAAMARVQVQAEDEGGDEEDYMQVVEYLRVTVMIIYLDCGLKEKVSAAEAVGIKTIDKRTRQTNLQNLFNKKIH